MRIRVIASAREFTVNDDASTPVRSRIVGISIFAALVPPSFFGTGGGVAGAGVTAAALDEEVITTATIMPITASTKTTIGATILRFICTCLNCFVTILFSIFLFFLLVTKKKSNQRSPPIPQKKRKKWTAGCKTSKGASTKRMLVVPSHASCA